MTIFFPNCHSDFAMSRQKQGINLLNKVGQNWVCGKCTIEHNENNIDDDIDEENDIDNGDHDDDGDEVNNGGHTGALVHHGQNLLRWTQLCELRTFDF